MNKKQESGAVTEDDFETAFEQTPGIELNSLRELRDTVTTLSNKLASDDWQHRIDNLRLLRGVVKGSRFDVDEIVSNVKFLDCELKGCISDLRSQVVREACITVAFLSKELRNKLELFLESLLENLINLVPNGVKIMSSSGKVALKIIVHNCEGPRLLPVFITSMTSSKSTMIRQYSCELMKMICVKWSVKYLDKSAANISEALKKGIYDADETARAQSREAFCWFNGKFPKIGEKVLQGLDSNKQKTLQKELALFKGDDSITVTDGPVKTFKVPNTPRSVIKQVSNPGRSRINSTKSEVPSANSSTEHIYVKPQPSFGWRSGKTKTTQKGDAGESRSRKLVSQSQPSTREPSPSSKSSYITYTNGGGEYKASNNFQKKGSSSNAYSSLRYKDAFENQVAEGLKRTRKASYDHYQSDDNVSETSSAISDNLVSFSDVFVLLNSKIWNERKRGLIKAERYILEMQLKPTERKSLIDVFNSMFMENQTVVVKKFLVVLHAFVDKHFDHLNDWLYPLLVKLLNLYANERLKSCRMDVQKLLNLLIDRYGTATLFINCSKFIVDKNYEPSIKVKLSLLEYMKNILTVSQPSLLENTNIDFATSLSNVLIWTAETKSTDLRKLSSNIVIKLFDLNSAQFTRILKSLPNSFQDRATAILNAYISTQTSRDDTSSDVGDSRIPKQKNESDKSSDMIRLNTEALQNMSLNCDNLDKHSVVSSGSNRSGASHSNAGTYQKGSSHNPFYNRSFIPTPRQNLNSLSSGNNYLYDNSNIQKYIASQNSHPELSIDNCSSNVSSNLYPATSNDSNVDSKYNPEYYSSGPIDTSIPSNRDVCHNSSSRVQPVIGYQTLRKIAELPPEDMMSEILKELSNHNDRHEERKACLFRLIKMFRESTYTDWDEHFKTLLFLLLETMADNEADIRAQALRVLQELAKVQAPRFMEFNQLTILKVLEAHKDTDKSVIKAAEECSRILTTVMPKKVCLKILIDVISDGNENQLCLPALKMLIKLVKNSDQESLDSDINGLCHALSTVLNHNESQVRKETVLCLVEIYKLIGDSIWPLVKLTNSQSRLLEVYIKKNIP